MSIYNFSVLKSNPLKITLNIDGETRNLSLYRIKFHGKETYPGDNWNWPRKKSKYTTDIKRIKDRAIRSWGNEKPQYGIDTPGYEGKLHFNDPLYAGGLSVYELTGEVAYQEYSGIKRCIGKLNKIEGKYIFTILPPKRQ